MRQAQSWFRRFKAALCVLLAVSLVLNCGQMAVRARGAERVFDIGVNPESVTATLDDSGLLTVSGSGEIRDFTPETAPFAAEAVTSLVIGPDIKVIGAYAFYGCGDLVGSLSLPKDLIAIGDGAFSGPDGEHAPNFDFVDNPFTEALRTRKREEASPAPAAVTSKPTEEPVSSAEPAAEDVETPAPTESAQPEASPSPAETPEASFTPVPAQQEPTGEPTGEPTAAPTEQPTEQTDNSENRYVIETITQQEMGKEVFFPREDAPLFTCGEGNDSFRQAMLDAGYREAEGVISAAFDCGAGSCEGGAVVKELPILSGRVTLPQALPEFSPPEGNELVSYSFGGWTESMDEANLVRKPGSEFTVGDREALYFIASWPQRVLLEIKRERDGEDMVFSVPEIESFTENYVFTSFCWQTCELAAGEEPPGNQDLLPWEDLPGETGQTYRRAIEAGDENRLFRCKITAEKKQQGFSLFSLFSAAEEEELSLAAVRGAVYAVEGQYTVTCSAGEYNGTPAVWNGTDPEMVSVNEGEYVVIPDCPYTMEKQGNDVVVFNGWQGSDGNSYDPGQIVKLSGNLTLTAQWAVATIKYVNGSAGTIGAIRAEGTASDPYRYFITRTIYPGAYNNLPAGGTKYTNIIVVCGNTTLSETNAKNATITSKDPATGTTYNCTLTLSGNVSLQGDTRFENLTWSSTKEQDRLFAKGHQVTMGQKLTMNDGYNFELYGDGNASGGGGVIVQSGRYRCVHGGSYSGNVSGDAKVEISGETTDIGVVCGASWLGGSVLTGDTYVYVFGDAKVAAVVGGNRSADDGAHITGTSHVIVGGSAHIATNSDVIGDTSFTSTGFVAGSGADSCFTSSGGNVRGGTFVEIRENAKVDTNVLGGSGDGWVDTDKLQNTVENYYALTGTAGGTHVLITGSATVYGSVFGGGNNRSCSGDTAVTVESGTISGSVYGGGLNGNVSGSSTVTISGGVISGNVYGGGQGLSSPPTESYYKQEETGLIGVNATVTVTGGEIKGKVFGGSKGAENTSVTGTVAGNSRVEMLGGEVGTYTGAGGKTLQSDTGYVFGGGEFAAVNGNSAVTINTAIVEGGHPVVGDSAFGGGSEAPVSGESSVTLENGLVGKNIYGGGSGASSVSGSTHVLMTNGQVGRYVYGGGALGAVSGNTQVEIQGGQIDYCAFAAGEGSAGDATLGRVSGTTNITMTGGTIAGGLYGGGNLGVVGEGSFIPTEADGKKTEYQAVKATVTMSGGEVQRVFAGGAGKGSDVKSEASPTDVTGADSADSFHGAVYGSTKLTITGGVVKGNVFGGSNRAYVVGGTNVSISGIVQIGNSIYGGSNLPDGDPSAGFDAAAYLVMGGSRVEINGAGGLTIGGGVLGSGKLTRVYGTRYVSIESYTGGLTTLQRADLLKMSNSTVTIQGEDDLSDEYADKPFSITQVRDMRLYKSDLTLLAEAKTLGALSNCDATLGGDTALHPSTPPSARTGLATDEATRSTVQLKPGLLLQVRYVSDSGDMTYGPVSGVFWLKMSAPAAEGLGVRVEASYDSDTGTGEAGNTGAFLPDPSETAEFVSRKIATSHSRWRLGGKTLMRTAILTAALTENGAENTVKSDWIDLPTSVESTVYKVTNVVFDGEFNLVKPVEIGTGITLPAFDETKKQHAGNTFSLRADPVGDGWLSTGSETAQWGPYLLTELPEGETAWNSGVEGVWKQGDATALLYTGSIGANGQVQFSLLYNGGYESFSGGTVEVTLKEFPTANQTDGAELNTVKILLTLAMDKSGSSQTAQVARGRTFNIMPEDEVAAISAKGAVTAEFLTEYYPSAAGSSNMYLHLCKEDGTEVAFPNGASVVLGDRSVAGQYQYYYCVSQGETGLCLENFTNLGATGTGYPGPSDVTNVLTERLRFVVDFSSASVQLSQGSYYLALTHRADQSLAERGVAEAVFSITADGTPTLQLAQDTGLSSSGVWALTVTTQAPESDTRYENGASIRLSLQLPDGTSASFPDLLSIRALRQDGEELPYFSESVMRDKSGTVSFTLPKSSVSTVLLDFSDVPDTMFSNGTYTLRAAMSPQVGLQVCADRVKVEDADATLNGLVMDRDAAAARSVYLSMESDIKRLVDASEGPAQMDFALTCENLLDSDVLTVEILRKTNREEPYDSSYAPVENQSQWGIAPASGTAAGELGSTLTVTVPQGQASGTYRIKIAVESGGKVVTDTEQVYNFIVK